MRKPEPINKGKRIEEVERPQVRDASTIFTVTPFILQTSKNWKKPETWDRMEEMEKIKFLLTDVDNIVLALGRPTMAQLTNFAKMFGCTPLQRVLQIFAMEAYETSGGGIGLVNPNMDGSFTTPYGVVHHPSIVLVCDLISWALALQGRIVAVDAKEEFGYRIEPMDADEIVDHLNEESLGLKDEKGISIFNHILKECGIYDHEKASEEYEKLREDTEKEEEDEKKVMLETQQ